jgi:hypothetical protein
MGYAYAACVVAGLLALWFSARAAITVAVLEVRDGAIRVTRGGIAPRILTDLGDVVESPRVTRATIRITRERGRASVALHGALSAAQSQRIRNVIGSVPLAALANARRRR